MTQYLRYGSIVLLAAVLFSVHLSGFWPELGAHPFWSKSASLIGIGAGSAIAILLLPIRHWRLVAFLFVLTGLAIYVSTIGKAEFAASYAENGFAGRFWYFGFIAFIAGLLASLSSLISLILPR